MNPSTAGVDAPDATDAGAVPAATAAWSRRVRRVGGLIQLGFATFWLIRGGWALRGPIGVVLTGLFVVLSVAVLVDGLRSTRGTAPRPTGPEALGLERAITVATVVQLVASFAAPALVMALGHHDWALPSIAVTIGPLLLWLDRRVGVPRYRVVGCALIVGPVLLAATVSGTALTAGTGIGAGALLLGSAAAGFRDLSRLRRDAEAETTASGRPW